MTGAWVSFVQELMSKKFVFVCLEVAPLSLLEACGVVPFQVFFWFLSALGCKGRLTLPTSVPYTTVRKFRTSVCDHANQCSLTAVSP